MDTVNPGEQRALPPRVRPASGLIGVLHGEALTAAEVQLTLSDGSTITARLERVVRDDAKGTQSWIGSFDDAPGSSLVLSRARGVVTGFANYRDQVLEIMPSAGGKHVLYAVDSDKLPPMHVQDTVVTGDDVFDQQGAVDDFGVAATVSASTNTVHDVLLLYTGAVASTFGSAATQSMLQSAVQSANQAYVNSRAYVTLNVVGLQQAPITESGISSTLSALRSNSTVKALRDKLGADMVVLVSMDSNSCGQAAVYYTTVNGVTNTEAHAVVNQACLSQYTLAHEIGHLQRLDHNRENPTGLAAYAYSYGYRRCTSTGGFRDIMSYSCTGAINRINHFSNPSVTYNGYPTGVSYESSPSTSADNARTLNNTAAMVAAYRRSTTTLTPTVPAAPSALVASSVLHDRVSLKWTDGSSNESGFKLQRSADGVNYSEIATLGSNATTFTDVAVAASSRYYYRVRAYNSAGTSSFSNTVSLTTPAASGGLLAPTSLAATVYSGKVSLRWYDNASNETGYRIQRSTDGSNFSKLADVGANVTTFADTKVRSKRRYYYRVRALNGASISAASNTISVTTP